MNGMCARGSDTHRVSENVMYIHIEYIDIEYLKMKVKKCGEKVKDKNV